MSYESRFERFEAVGPDGDVYFGVVSGTAPAYHNGRGWLLHFNATLTHEKIPGSFGWDDTASVVDDFLEFSGGRFALPRVKIRLTTNVGCFETGKVGEERNLSQLDGTSYLQAFNCCRRIFAD